MLTIAERNYLEAELFAVANLPVDDKHFPYGFNMQIRSERGATKWLKISPRQMKAIELILLAGDEQ
jgi:hypothetical protein